MTLWDRFFYIKVFFINTPSAVSFCAKMRMPIFNFFEYVCLRRPATATGENFHSPLFGAAKFPILAGGVNMKSTQKNIRSWQQKKW